MGAGNGKGALPWAEVLASGVLGGCESSCLQGYINYLVP